jgi:hypothetical protein
MMRPVRGLPGEDGIVDASDGEGGGAGAGRAAEAGGRDGGVADLPHAFLQSMPITVERCLPPGRRICFAGDSHMRYLHNTLALWVGKFMGHIRNYDDALRSKWATYFKVHWSKDWPKRGHHSGGKGDPFLERNCTDVVANMGQWSASFRTGKSGPHSVGRYLADVMAV